MKPYNDTTKDTKKVKEALEGPMIIRDVEIFVEYYIGASSPSNIKECKTFYPFRESDQLAQYANEHKLPYAIHDENILKKQFQFNILTYFQKALFNNELFMTYQPIVQTSSLEIKKFEALIRWNKANGEVVMPNDFIPLVENTQLVHDLFKYVLTKAINKIQEFHKIGKKDCNISINLSGKNFNDNLLETIDVVINKTCPDCASFITLEITETVLMDNPKSSATIIDALKQRGFHIAIDDFGKGYSSFTYLSRFNVDYIKIDGYFINNIETKSIYNIVKASIDLAHQLDFEVIAEWVEDEKSCSILEDIGCDYLQGFYFSKPIHEDKITEYYKKYKAQLNEKNK